MIDVVIVGSGGFARETKCLLDNINKTDSKYSFLGWVSNEKAGAIVDEYPVLGDDNWLLNRKDRIGVIIAIGDGLLRKKIYNKLKKSDYLFFPNVIAPDVRFSDFIDIGIGCIITYNCIFTTNISIGDFFICNLSCTVGHDTIIGDYVTLYPGVNVSGNVNLNDNVSIGTGACIIENIQVGKGTFVGAGACVVNDLEGKSVAVGVPAKIIRKK